MPHSIEILAAIERNESAELLRLLSARAKSFSIDEVNDAGETYFYTAVKRLLKNNGEYSLRILEILLQYGIDPNKADKLGFAPLDICEVNCWDKDTFCTPLIRTIREPLPLLFQALLMSKADKNFTSKAGKSPVCEAATIGRVDMLKKLIDAGANIFVGYGSTSKDYNPLALALKYRLDIDKKSSEQAIQNAEQCVGILLKKYAGIGMSFIVRREAAKKAKFHHHKVILGAEVDKDLMSHESFQGAIVTVDDLEKYFKISNKSAEDIIIELQAIKLACLQIETATQKINVDVCKRVQKVIKELDNKWPVLKTTVRLASPLLLSPNGGWPGLFRGSRNVPLAPSSAPSPKHQNPPATSVYPAMISKPE